MRTVKPLAALGLIACLAAPDSLQAADNDGWTAARRRATATPGLLEPARNARPIARPSSTSVFQPPRAERSAASSSDTAGASALLIRNPNTRNGEPPFALADQFGQVQRFVEPVAGVDLNRHVGQIVGVRHDTGQTLLASQLMLSPTGLPAPGASVAQTPSPAFVGQLAYGAAPRRYSYDPAHPVIITQFGEQAAESDTTPEPIVLEEIIGEPTVQPVEGLPLPSGQGLPSLSMPSNPAPPPPVMANKSPAPYQPTACLSPSCGCCDTASPNVYFEAELLLLRMFDSDPTVTNDSYESGGRFTLGMKTPSGSHWTARYLDYENELYDGVDTLSLQLYDLEYGRYFKLGCRWQGLFTIGGRITEFQDTNNQSYDDAFGPVLGAQLRGPRWGQFHPLLGVRHSLQFGENQNNRYGSFTVTELAAGVEYQRHTNSGSTLFGRAAAETILLDGPMDNDSENAALVGVGLSLGITR